MTDACVFLLENREFKDTFEPTTKEIRNTYINIGTGKNVSIKELAELIKTIVGYNGKLVFNTDKLDGTMVKITAPSKLHALGGRMELSESIKTLFYWYLRRS